MRRLLSASDRESVGPAAELLTDLDYLQGPLGDVPPESAGERAPTAGDEGATR